MKPSNDTTTATLLNHCPKANTSGTTLRQTPAPPPRHTRPSTLSRNDGVEALARSPRRQHVSAGRGHARKNGGHLVGSFPGSEDHLGHAGAQAAMMIELGETQVFEWQDAQLLHGIVNVDTAFAHFIEQRLDLRTIHS